MFFLLIGLGIVVSLLIDLDGFLRYDNREIIANYENAEN